VSQAPRADCRGVLYLVVSPKKEDLRVQKFLRQDLDVVGERVSGASLQVHKDVGHGRVGKTEDDEQLKLTQRNVMGALAA